MKMISISEPNTWRPDGKTLLHFGTYRVPEDMSDELAARAVAEGVAVEVAEVVDKVDEPTKARRTKV